MRTVQLPETAIPGRPTEYKRHVIEQGHTPGVLSGAELQGKAKLFSASYAKTRAAVASALRVATGGKIDDALILHPESRRYVRVWIDCDSGERVRLELTP